MTNTAADDYLLDVYYMVGRKPAHIRDRWAAAPDRYLCGRIPPRYRRAAHVSRTISEVEAETTMKQSLTVFCQQCVRAFQSYRSPLQRLSEIR